jgi:hypothetical protein
MHRELCDLDSFAGMRTLLKKKWYVCVWTTVYLTMLPIARIIEWLADSELERDIETSGCGLIWHFITFATRYWGQPQRTLSICGSIVLLLDHGRFFNFWILYTIRRTPSTGDQPVTRPLPTHRTTQTQNKRTQISMPWVGFEPTTPAFERAKIDRAASVVGPHRIVYIPSKIVAGNPPNRNQETLHHEPTCGVRVTYSIL